MLLKSRKKRWCGLATEYPKMKLESLKGKLLIANSSLRNSYFAEAVILILEHDNLGAFGLLLNRPEKSHKHLGSLLNIVATSSKHISFYEGGPVGEENLFIIHTDASNVHAGKEIIPDVFWDSSAELLRELCNCPHSFNLYRGYVGWGPFQLETEIRSNSWVIAPALESIIFLNSPTAMWRKALQTNGGIYSYFAKKVKDPLLN